MQPHRSLWVKFGDVNDNADAKKHHVEFCKRGRPGAWWRLVGTHSRTEVDDWITAVGLICSNLLPTAYQVARTAASLILIAA